MKSLTEYIQENQDTFLEGNETYVRFTLYGCDASKTAENNISLIAQRNGIYFEKIDNGFKLKIKPGQNVNEIADELEKLIDSIPDDKKDELQSKTDNIMSSINNMKDAASAESGEQSFMNKFSWSCIS